MRWLNPIVAAVVAGVLSLLLIIYVLAGDSNRRKNPDKLSEEAIEGASQPGREARCASQQTYNLIKGELFRRAADVRGDDQAAFDNFASYAVLRLGSSRLTSDERDAGAITCAGTLTLDLPPGLAVAGGRRSLTAAVAYAIRPAASQRDDTLTLSGAEAIILPLATLSRALSVEDELRTSSSADENMQSPASPPNDSSTQAVPPRASPTPRPASEPARRPGPSKTVPAPPSASEASRRPAAPRESTAAPLVTKSPAPTRQTAVLSFNCRNARTRGEIAACNDGNLASLDRQMAGHFNRAMAVANPAQRTLLQRTRGSFLRYRDSCGSNACMAGAYRDRVREIDDIVAGRWNPR